MKVILSRKGLDTSFGDNAGNLLLFNQDKSKAELIMLPISELDSYRTYSDTLNHWGLDSGNGDSYKKYMYLFENFKFLEKYYPLRRWDNRLVEEEREINPENLWSSWCHPDPDIMPHERPFGTFGQVGPAQSHLENQKVGVNDLFIFFGLFNEGVDYYDKVIYFNSKKQKHIMFGYLQIGEIIKTSDLNENQIKYYDKKYNPYIGLNPHWDYNYDPYDSYWPTYMPAPDNTVQPKYKLRKKHYWIDKTNCIYVSRETCTFDENIKGFGMFEFDENLILTKQGESAPTHWELPQELQGLKISYHNDNSQKKDYFQSALRGQEFVIEECPQAEQWALNLIKKYSKNRGVK